MTDPAEFRAQFPVLERVSYLNAGTEGPLPRAPPTRCVSGSRPRSPAAVPARRTSTSVRGLAGELRAGYARVLGADPADVALTGSTTDGVNTILAGLDLRPGDEIVTSDEEHPGLLAPLGRLKRRGRGDRCRSCRSREIAERGDVLDAAGGRARTSPG